jgi:hypothetical protein
MTDPADTRAAITAIGAAGNALAKLEPEHAWTLFLALFAPVFQRIPPDERFACLDALCALADPDDPNTYGLVRDE